MISKPSMVAAVLLAAGGAGAFLLVLSADRTFLSQTEVESRTQVDPVRSKTPLNQEGSVLGETKEFSEARSERPQSVDFDTVDWIMRASEQDWKTPETAGPLMKALVQWARRDADACERWLAGLSPELAGTLAQEAAGALMKDSALVSLQLLNGLPPSPKGDEMLRQAAMQLASVDLNAAREWAGLQTDPAAAGLLWSAIATAMAGENPQLAVNAALEHLEDPGLRDRALVEIVQRWMQKDLAAAAACAVTLGGDAGIAAASAVSSHWSRVSPATCESWIWSIKSPELKTSAFSAYVDDRVLVDRAGMQRLATQLQDPHLLGILRAALDR